MTSEGGASNSHPLRFSKATGRNSSQGACATTIAPLESVGFEAPATGAVRNYTWPGAASIVDGVCLAPIGPHKGKSISLTTGEITDC